MTPSGKRQTTAPADGDTRVVVVVEDRCDSPPANQEALAELPWGPLYQSSSESESVEDAWIINTPPHYYDDDDEVDEDAIASSPAHENEDDDNFTFSPASPPPLTQSTQEDMASIPRLYVFPDETVVVTADGEHICIPDQHTKTHLITQSTSTIEDPKPSASSSIITHPKPSTIEDPKPSTSASSSIITHPKPSTIEDPKPSTSTMEEEDDAKEDPRKVCFLTMQTNIARLIAHQWRKSAPLTVEDVTVDVCRSLAVTVLSAPYQEILMKYVRCAIRRPR